MCLYHSHLLHHRKGKNKVTFRGQMVLPSTKINLGHPLLRFLEHTRTHTHTHTHTRQNFSERVIGSSQRKLPTQHTTNTGNEHPCPQRHSKTQSLIHADADLRLKSHGYRHVRWFYLLYFILLYFFYLRLASFNLFIAGVRGYCCLWSQSMTHTQSVGLL